MSRHRWIPLALALASAACGEDAPATPAPSEPAPAVPVDIDDPSECVTCHAPIVEEWRTSMHAHAHHDSDPLYAAMRRFRMGREGEQLARGCAACHGPRDPADPESEISRRGVTCTSCHAVSAVHASDDRRGAAALDWDADGALRGPHDVGEHAPSPHAVGDAAPFIADGQTLCLACHGSLQNAQQVDTCTTGSEYAAASGDASCASCHMPEVDGPSGVVTTRPTHRSHAFLGPHALYREGGERDFLASAVELAPTLEGSTLRLSIENVTRHAFPTGFPGRMVMARVTGFDSDGEAVWHSFEENPLTEDPDAVFTKVYVDEAGQPAMPPYAARIARDSRLRPGETRTLEWTLPDGVARAEVTLFFRLMPPPALARLGVEGIPETQGRAFATVSVSR